ncbi:PHP domain-containing protein [Kribbia dieselivorans]|uniref:PHP domain-containing protein n=1 Tax=Kribbia dieselivorans TaxID=331526 RepID=UPI0008395C68|nr:PHP domain-containing protein [Kribbia dieselivorans]
MIDLHTHSTASDGTRTPAEVVQDSVEAGLSVLALTDHDTSIGWGEAATAAQHHGIGLLRGMEISCTHNGRSLHLLGYLVDPDHPELVAELTKARVSRETRLERMVEKLAADGIPITMAAVHAQMGAETTPGRPHIADALVASGYISDRNEAFTDLLHDNSKYYVAHYAIPAVRGVEVVRAAGGVAVIAHPFASKRGYRHPVEIIERMAAAGLAGIEVDHSDHDEAARAELRGVAADLGVFTTGSSDYHGAGKPNRLGENTTSPEVLEQIIDLAHSSVPYLPGR